MAYTRIVIAESRICHKNMVVAVSIIWGARENSQIQFAYLRFLG